MCQEFLWGLGSEGNPRIPLIAWDKVTMPKLIGSLGLTSFQTQARALKVCSISKMFEDNDLEWVLLAQEIANHGLRKGRWSREMRTWSAQDFLILGHDMKVQSRTLKGILSGWIELSAPILKLKPCSLPLSC